jgi:hypothetical protein
MKVSHILLILIVFAWPLNYLYQRQLGAISFLLLAIFFSVITIKETKKLKKQENGDTLKSNQKKIK